VEKGSEEEGEVAELDTTVPDEEMAASGSGSEDGESGDSSSGEEEGEEEVTFNGKAAATGLQDVILDASDLASQKRKRTAPAGPALDVAAGLFWDGDGNAAEAVDSGSGGDSEGEAGAAASADEAHGSKRAKRAAKKKEEASIQRAEDAQLDATAGAQSAEEFERMLMARPQSSYLWSDLPSPPCHAPRRRDLLAMMCLP